MIRRHFAIHPHFTKIVATVSGSEADRPFLQKLFEAGMDVVRINSAHATLEEMRRLVSDVRAVSPTLAVLVDTKGPNIRTCNVPDEGILLKAGQAVRLSGIPGDDGRICVNYTPFTQEVPVGATIVCDDGAAKFEVYGKDGDCLLAHALFDATVRDRKSVNVPDVSLKAPALTDKDRLFLAEAARLQCDFIAHSFVRNADDVRQVREILGDAGKDIRIIAKIENREGVKNIQEILDTADGIMVARGDLGIEIPLEEVPAIQKKLIYEARLHGKPVITATQMLQSMENAPSPTRAEVSDVANAVYDGTDAVMLSGETAHGHFPVEAVEMMRKIIVSAEDAPREFFTKLPFEPVSNTREAYLLKDVIHATQQLPVDIIVCSTLEGRSARCCSAYRPEVAIYAPTPNEMTMRQLSLNYGVFSTLVPFQADPTEQAVMACKNLHDILSFLGKDPLLVILGRIFKKHTQHDILLIATLGELNEKMG